jgi:putative ABC transport system ATP-binding protein
MEIITAVDVNKYCHKGGKKIHVLKNVNLHIEIGDFTVITGSSESDRTVLLHFLCGIEKPDKGNIFFCGIDTKKMAKWQYKNLHRYSIGTVFHDEKINPFLSIMDNVAAGLMIKGEKRKAALEKSYVLLDNFGVVELGNKKSSKLSEEQKRIIVIARTIIKEPPIIIAGEPTVNLNYDNREKVIHLFNDLNKTKKTTIIISTTDDVILQYAKKVISLIDGAIVMEKSTE